MKRISYIFAWCVSAAALTACSYNLDLKQDRGLPIVVSAGCAPSTKAEGVPFPSTHDIYLSAHYIDGNRPELNDDYFVGRLFSNNGGQWKSFPASYWPIGGSLSFASIALDPSDAQIMETARWAGGDCTAGVSIDVPSGRSLENEIMYAYSPTVTGKNGSVNLNFEHCEAWIEFVFDSNADGIFRIDGVEMLDAFDGGTLSVNNSVFNRYSWSHRGDNPRNYFLPVTKDMEVPAEGCSCTSYIPEQMQTGIIVHYRQRTDTGVPWENATQKTFVRDFPNNLWYAGAHYIYRLTLNATEILFEAEVCDWTDSSQELEIETENL